MYKKLLAWAFFTYLLKPTAAQPVIQSISPLSGTIGTTVTITGSNFIGNPDSNIVLFGTVKAPVIAATNTTLTVTVPAGATYQPVTVTTRNLTAYSRQRFVITFYGGGRLLPGSFRDKTDFSSTNSTTSLLADIDGDGQCDILTTESGLCIYRNTSSNGTLSLAPKVSYSARAGLTGMATGDLDGDGKPDIAVAAYAPTTSGFSIFRNNSSPGNISLDQRKDYGSGNSTSSYADDVVITDLDGDGKPDVAVHNGDRTMTVYRNISTGPGNITLRFVQNFPVGMGAGNICFSDLDGDRRPELIVTSGINSSTSIFRNTSYSGNISFESTGVMGAAYASVGDLDNDGKDDIVLAVYPNQRAYILKNTSTYGNISFVTAASCYVDNTPVSTAISDVDGDGNPDVVVAEAQFDRVYVFRHSNDKTTIAFDSAVVYPGNWRTYSVRVADIDMDGTPDIVSCGLGMGKASLFRNTVRYPHILSITPVSGSAGTVVTISGYNFTNASAVNFGSIPAGSFTVISDSVIQAVAGTGAHGVIGITNGYGTNTGPVFSNLSSIPVINSFSPLYGDTGTIVTLHGSNFDIIPANNIVRFGDVNSPVLSATANAITVKVPPGASYKPITITANGLMASSWNQFTPTYKGAPANFLATSFADKKEFPASLSPIAVATSDIDGDGKTDVIVSNYGTASMSVFPNTSTTGHINLASRIDIVNSLSPDYFTVADINADGKPDLLINSYQTKTVSILINTSSPGVFSFGQKADFIAGSRLIVGDVDGDGLPDIVADAYLQNGNFSVLHNISGGGNISFESAKYFAAGNHPRAIALHDLNNDGKPEVILVNSSDTTIYVYVNTSTVGSVSFAPPLVYKAGPYAHEWIFIGDLNKDSLPDLMTWYGQAAINPLRNTSIAGNINFDPFSTIETPIKVGDIGFGDLDGDTRPDMVTGYQNMIMVLKNISTNQINFLPRLYTSATVNYGGFYTSDIDNDGKPDIIFNGSNNKLSVVRNKMNEPLVTPSDSIISRVFIDPVVQTYNDTPYVQRHYDIVSERTVPAATDTITLYFSQEEFDNYNAFAAHGTDLPHNPTDSANKANLRIIQYHGINSLEINPDDDKIIWNDTASWWEVTFNTSGFSSFFARSVPLNNVPIEFIPISAHRHDNDAIIQWVTPPHLNISYFKLERSTDGNSFSSIAQIEATNYRGANFYQYTDELGTAPVYYYRLLIIHKDSTMTTSKIVSVKTEPAHPGHNKITLWPNPAKDFVLVQYPVASPGDKILLIDMSGHIVKTIVLESKSQQTTIYLNGLLRGVYQVVYKGRTNSFCTSLLVK